MTSIIDNDNTDCTFEYFKPSGKWAYSGRGIFSCKDDGTATAENIYETNNGMPGITSKGKQYFIVVIPDGSCEHSFAYPRLIKPTI